MVRSSLRPLRLGPCGLPRQPDGPFGPYLKVIGERERERERGRTSGGALTIRGNCHNGGLASFSLARLGWVSGATSVVVVSGATAVVELGCYSGGRAWVPQRWVPRLWFIFGCLVPQNLSGSSSPQLVLVLSAEGKVCDGGLTV